MSDANNTINLQVQTALDLTLNGSVGSFRVGDSQQGGQGLEVKYFLTHVGLNFSTGQDEKLLKELAPFREVFDTTQLDFDQIMQRDIDDARVSAELIPYILDDRTQDLVKFFPPIVVVVLPVSGDRNKPDDYYPGVTSVPESLDKMGVKDWLVTQSGKVGSEVFRFEQPVISEEPDKHNLVNFKLNTSKARMVIVDGQHRAMALLALYRNLKDQWSDAKRKPFQKYYEEWTPSYIEKFNLDEINLPMIICTIPSLDAEYKGDYTLKKASRSIFLTLNKNARAVSRTRNILLDDNDLISTFMRSTLGEVKDLDARSETSLRIHNVELDQDKTKLNAPIAMTGVSHLYYAIEHMLLDSGDVDGVKPRSGKFGGRTGFSDALDRLACVDKCGADVCKDTKRNLFSAEVEEILTSSFSDLYGTYLLKVLKAFQPYEIHNKAAQKLKTNLESSSDVDLESMLFGGQGMVKVFETHRHTLKKNLKDGYFKTDVPRIESIVESLDATDKRLKTNVDDFEKQRANNFVNANNEKNKFRCAGSSEVPNLILELINNLYSNIYTTVAFQAALTCGFFTEFEKASKTFSGSLDLDVQQTFDEYLKQMSGFFVPKTFASFRKMISILIGNAEGDDACNLTISEGSSDSFRSVVMRGEMQPDQWPKYRYIMLEIWNPSNFEFNELISRERKYCRNQVFRSLLDFRLKELAKKLRKSESDLTDSEKRTAFDESYSDLGSFLKNLGRGSEISISEMKKAISEAGEKDDDED